MSDVAVRYTKQIDQRLAELLDATDTNATIKEAMNYSVVAGGNACARRLISWPMRFWTAI